MNDHIVSQIDCMMDRQAEDEEMDYWIPFAFAVRDQMRQRCASYALRMSAINPIEDQVKHPRRSEYRNAPPPDLEQALQDALLWGHLMWAALCARRMVS